MGRHKKSVLEYDDVILAVNYAMEEGIEIGRKRARERQEKEARERGFEIGRKEVRISFIRRCLARNMSIDTIADLMGITTEEVSAILTD